MARKPTKTSQTRQRKVEFTEDVIKELEKRAKVGSTMDQLADYLMITPRTFYTYRQENQELNFRMKKAKAEALAAIAGTVYQRAMTDTKAAMFVLSTQGGWSIQGKHTKLLAIDIDED